MRESAAEHPRIRALSEAGRAQPRNCPTVYSMQPVWSKPQRASWALRPSLSPRPSRPPATGSGLVDGIRIQATSARSSGARQRLVRRRLGYRRVAPIPGRPNACEAAWERSSFFQSGIGSICGWLCGGLLAACWWPMLPPRFPSTTPTCRVPWFCNRRGGPRCIARPARCGRPPRQSSDGADGGIPQCGSRSGGGVFRVEETQVMTPVRLMSLSAVKFT